MTVLDAPAGAPASAGQGAPPARAGGLAVLDLTEPLPGFPGYRDYALVPVDATGLVHWLQAIDPDGPRFVVVPAAPFFPDYAPSLPAALRTELGLEDVAEPRLFCLVTVPDGDISAATANLRAPLAVNEALGRARQVVLADGGHPIRRPLRR
ncbi:MAG: fliW [Blastococcus sp.]|jgi:flagellar assembly factor FliW|nr:fliW [Blastococcus sp.]